jgi:hypothetical protein
MAPAHMTMTTERQPAQAPKPKGPAGRISLLGNDSADVKARAHFVSSSNNEDGFAAAIEQFVLPRVAHAGRPQ